MSGWDGFDYRIIANRYQQTFVQGYLDVSGRTIIRNGDLSLNNGNLFVGYDTSMNGNVNIGKDLTIAGRLSVKQYSAQNIINTTTTNYQLIVSEDLSLNGRMYVSGNVGIGTTNPSQTLDVNGNIQVSRQNNATISVTPNLSGITGNVWIKNNITWTASASSSGTTSSRFPYKQFDTTANGWGTSTESYNTTSPFGYSGTTYSTSINFPANSRSIGTDMTTLTTISGTNTIYGEWLQIDSSVNSSIALTMTQFTLFNHNTTTGSSPSVYYICGSNDGTNFEPIVNVTYSGTWVNNVTFNALTIPTSSTVSTSLTTSTASGALNYAYLSYGNGTKTYKYFRFIVIAGIGNRLSSGAGTTDGYRWFGEWTPTFNATGQVVISSNASNCGQLDVNGTIGTQYIAPIYTTPYFSEGMIGYTYTPTVTWTPTALTSIASQQSLPAGCYIAIINISLASTAINFVYYSHPADANRTPFVSSAGNYSIANGSVQFTYTSTNTFTVYNFAANSSSMNYGRLTITRIA